MLSKKILFLFAVTVAGWNLVNSQFRCPSNEVGTDCVNPCNTCDQRGRCAIRPLCRPGCDCRPGCLRNEQGVCIPEEQCDAYEDPHDNYDRCPENAVFSSCSSPCPPTCDDPYPEECSNECVADCQCKQGFLKTKDGRCVPRDQCDSTEYPGRKSECPENAELLPCGKICPPTCENPREEPCDLKCEKACYCKPGYLKRRDNKCVLPEQCGSQIAPPSRRSECPENAELLPCGTICPPTCENPREEPCELKCEKACYCKPGYLKSKDDRCVLPDQCEAQTAPDSKTPECPDNSELLPCGKICPPTCDNPRAEPCELKCQLACFCKPGYLKSEEDKCVRPEQCDARTKPDYKCAEGEQYYSECTPSCKNTCRNYNNPGVRCKCGPPGCFCKEGLVKRNDGKCVSPQQCKATPPKCPANSVFVTCGSACPATCDNPYPGPCTYQCVAGCSCKQGFIKNKSGGCVRPRHCNQTDVPTIPPKCPANSVFLKCGTACPATCGNPFPGPCTLPCVSACYCKKGYLKNRRGRCVRPYHCNRTDVPNPLPPPRCSENQHFVPCGSDRPPTCEQPRPEETTGRCVPGCYCKPGFLKNEYGKCVLPEDCNDYQPGDGKTRLKCRENEVLLTCGSRCPPSCKNPRPKNCTGPCVTGCFCDTGLLRNQEGKCVPPKQCSTKDYTRCRVPDEEFRECGTSCPDTCKNKGHPLPAYCAGKCVRGCFCKKGLFRTREGACVYLKDCPKHDRNTSTHVPEVVQPKCHENAVFLECCSACPKTCEDPKPTPCGERCIPGCTCRPGFLMSKDGKCVRPHQCPKRCRYPEEEFLECRTTCPDTCENRGLPPICVYRQCVRGCFCKKGLFRTKTGTCVPLNECPAVNESSTTDYGTYATTEGITPLPASNSYGCPDRAACDKWCKTKGIFTGLCVGETECRCI